MSRSKKKIAITGWTTARSEKEDKRIINRSLRRQTRRILNSEGAEDAILPVQDDVMSLWSMAKDGKCWHREEKAPDCSNCTYKIRCLTDEDYKVHNCRPWWRHQWYLKALRK